MTCSIMGEGSEGGDSGCGTDARGDWGDVWGSTGGDGGVGDSHFDVSGEERGDDGEMGLGSGACSSVSSSTDICISTSVVSLGNGNSSLNNAEAGGHSAIAVSTAGDGDRGDGVLEVEAGVGGRSVGTSTLDGASEPIEVEEVGGGSMKDDGVDMDTSSGLPIIGGSGDSSRGAVEDSVVQSSISIRAGSGSKDGVGDTSVTDNVLLKRLHFSAGEGDAEEGSSFVCILTFSGVGDKLLRGGCWGIEGELDITMEIAGKRSERSANLERDKTDGTANALVAVDGDTMVGTEGGGMRCCSSNKYLNKNVKKKRK